MMKERPILFSAPMVKAILDGRKTQTRRIVNWKRLHKQAALPFPTKCTLAVFSILKGWGLDVGDGMLRAVECPYGAPGDRLWVKETWADAAKNVDPEIAIEAGYKTVAEARKAHARWAFRADYDNYMGPLKWTPSIFMPRWASRITLEVLLVRVERLQEIEEWEARDEGGPSILGYKDGRGVHGYETYRDWYEDLWESINGPGSWKRNPWVWVVEFRRVP